MKFYLGTDENGKRTLYPWEKDIPKGVKAPEIDIPTDKTGLMKAIQELLTEADEANTQAMQGLGTAVSVLHEHLEEKAAQTEEEFKAKDYAAWSCRIEDSWDKLSLAQKLHFASLAMEDAREQLPRVLPNNIKGES